MRLLAITLATATLALPLAANAQSNPLSSIFNCSNPSNRQGSGAVVGGVLGGLAGNQVAGDGDRTIGTVLGAALGAAAGSYVGCQVSGADTAQAETATLEALNQNRTTTWSNTRTGAYGRTEIVQSYARQDRAGPESARGENSTSRRPSRDDRNGYARESSLDGLEFARGIDRPNGYASIDDRYTAPGQVNIRSRPNTRSAIVGQLRRGEQFDAVARTADRNWLLVRRNGVAVGYVSQSVVRFVGPNSTVGRQASPNYDRRGDGERRQQRADVTCRVFDQSVSGGNGTRQTTQRFTACQNERGEWVVQS